MSGEFVILIVDDHPSNRFTARELLSRLPGTEILEASSGPEALRQTVERDVHLILLDIHMPGMDGYETARHLQMTGRTRNIPIVFLTAVYKAEEFIKHGYALGAADYLTKPIDDNLLLNRVRLYQHLHERESSLLATLEAKRRQDEDLVLALERANAANLAKSNFLANMSHEIRTPMNAILGMTHLALQTELTDQQRRYLQRANAAANGLLGILNDILDFSKIEAGRLEMDAREFLLEEVFEQVTHLVGTKLKEKRLDFMLDRAPDVPASLIGDPLRLGQVITNLCSNAVKFTEAGEITVVTSRIAGLETDRVTLQFSVRDTGIGMTPEQTRELFQPFSQVDASSTRKFGGTGLGLAICRHLVDMMGGEIWVVSEPGLGSEFSFTATFGLGHLEARPSQSKALQLGELRVLIVDDSPVSLKILGALAQGLGFQAATVASAEEGFAELKRVRYDLVLLDWHMPEVDGFEAARRIRQELGLPVVPKLVLVTAYGDEEVAQRAGQEGLDGYLAKPVTASSLFDAVMNAFGGHVADPSARRRPSRRSAMEAHTRLQGTRMLLVEDNEFNQQVASELLAMMGVEVTLAANGREALDQVRSRTFDAVLMDLQMPEMDGYETTRRLRANPALRDLPILAMTAHAMVQERERCASLGMNDFITKPIDPEELFATLAKWVRRGHPQLPTGPEAGLETNRGDSPQTDLPGLSWEEGLARFSGKASLYEKMLNKFLELKAGAAGELRAALDQGDPETAARLAHSMISAAGSIGANALSSTARELDQAIRAGVPEPVNDLLAQFEAELATLISGLQGHCGGR
jgi:CheY-like chemotaxis protein/HPt (histidine-containing phosphotransfer) domain-containing protein